MLDANVRDTVFLDYVPVFNNFMLCNNCEDDMIINYILTYYNINKYF